MLFGEHSVLRGGTALVAAIEPRLTVTLTPTSDQTISIESSLGSASTPINNISLGKTFQFIEKSLLLFQGKFPCGAHITVESGMNPSMGLGTSAAVTVALLSCLGVWFEKPFTRENLLLKAREVIRAVQGSGSGADVASSVWGGVISYRAEPPSVSLLRRDLPLSLLYSGKKTPTPHVIAYVNEQEELFPNIFSSIFATIEKATKEATIAIQSEDWKRLGKLMDIHHGLLEALLVGTPNLSSAYWNLKQSPTIFGAKISGSGLGDSVIGLGSSAVGVSVHVASDGVHVS